MLKLWSTAVTHTAASPPQPHRLYWLIWVCVWEGGALAAILGPLTLTLLPFGWIASLDTFLLSSLFFQLQSLSVSPLLLTTSEIFCNSPSVSRVSQSYPPSCHYLCAKSPAISTQVPSITSSPPSRLCLHSLHLNYLLFTLGQLLRPSLSLSPPSCLFPSIYSIFPNGYKLCGWNANYLLMIQTEGSPALMQWHGVV